MARFADSLGTRHWFVLLIVTMGKMKVVTEFSDILGNCLGELFRCFMREANRVDSWAQLRPYEDEVS